MQNIDNNLELNLLMFDPVLPVMVVTDSNKVNGFAVHKGWIYTTGRGKTNAHPLNKDRLIGLEYFSSRKGVVDSQTHDDDLVISKNVRHYAMVMNEQFIKQAMESSEAKKEEKSHQQWFRDQMNAFRAIEKKEQKKALEPTSPVPKKQKVDQQQPQQHEIVRQQQRQQELRQQQIAAFDNDNFSFFHGEDGSHDRGSGGLSHYGPNSQNNGGHGQHSSRRSNNKRRSNSHGRR